MPNLPDPKYKQAYVTFRNELNLQLVGKVVEAGLPHPHSLTLEQSISDLAALLLNGAEPAGQLDAVLDESQANAAAGLPGHVAELERARVELEALVYQSR